jgi:thiamine biosynthesis lipoprotein
VLGIEVLTPVPTIHSYDPTYWVAHARKAMGSVAQLVVGDAPPGVVDWAFEEIERLEQSWSRFRDTSELSILNASPGRAVEVSPRLWSALTRCEELWRATHGAFDPTILEALEEWGYDRSFEVVRAANAARSAPSSARVPGWSLVRLDTEARTVRLMGGVRIDLGGIGKGLAADLVATGLVDRGAASACVALGGDIRVAGRSPEDPGWSVPVEDAALGMETFTTDVKEGALAMSTTLLRRWRRGSAEVHHIIDPADGRPAHSGLVAAVVSAPQAWWAEGLAKAAIVEGRYGGEALLRRCGVEGWLTSEDGTTTRVGIDAEGSS